jgi:cellulose synthase/poly-beta-1,6-N-acetylglucosamine synthase-like glycosyltransferase
MSHEIRVIQQFINRRLRLSWKSKSDGWLMERHGGEVKVRNRNNSFFFFFFYHSHIWQLNLYLWTYLPLDSCHLFLSVFDTMRLPNCPSLLKLLCIWNGVLDTPPHIPSGSEWIPRNLVGMVGIWLEWMSVRTHPNFTRTRNHSNQIPTKFQAVRSDSLGSQSY